MKNGTVGNHSSKADHRNIRNGGNHGNQDVSNHGNKRYSNPLTGLDRPGGFQEVEAPRFQDNRHMNAVMLSVLRTGRL